MIEAPCEKLCTCMERGKQDQRRTHQYQELPKALMKKKGMLCYVNNVLFTFLQSIFMLF